MFSLSSCDLQSIDGSHDGQMQTQSTLPIVQSVDGQQKINQNSNLRQKVCQRTTKNGLKYNGRQKVHQRTLQNGSLTDEIVCQWTL